MKKGLFFLFVVVVALAGCAAPRQYQASRVKPQAVISIPAGYVPLVVENPELENQVYMVFLGGQEVKIVPNPQGGEMFNRPPMVFIVTDGDTVKREHRFFIPKADDRFSNLTYRKIWVPRSSNFVIITQKVKLGMTSSLAFIYASTGEHSQAREYTERSLLVYRGKAGGFVSLANNEPLVGFGSGPLQLRKTFDLTWVGSYVADRLTGWIFGR